MLPVPGPTSNTTSVGLKAAWKNVTQKTMVHITYLQSIIKKSVEQILLYTTLCDKVCQWLAIGQWFSPGTLVPSINKTDCHDITEILLKPALNTITLTQY